MLQEHFFQKFCTYAIYSQLALLFLQGKAWVECQCHKQRYLVSLNPAGIFFTFSFKIIYAGQIICFLSV